MEQGGIGFFGLLTIVFIALKLTGYITWSWWWVLSPIWIPIPILFIALMAILFIALMAIFFMLGSGKDRS